MKRRNLLLAALAVVLVLSAGIGTASAYFTARLVTYGGHVVELGSSGTTEVYERFSQWTKHVTVTSAADSEPAYIRIRAYYGSSYSVAYNGNGAWSDGGDGWWYYNSILQPASSTDEFDVTITNVPTDVTEGDEFNIVVIYESTSVRYRADGTPYADWSVRLDTGAVGGVS